MIVSMDPTILYSFNLVRSVKIQIVKHGLEIFLNTWSIVEDSLLHEALSFFELKAEGAKVMRLIVRDVVLGREEFVQDHSFSAVHCGDIDVKSSDPSPAELDQGSH